MSGRHRLDPETQGRRLLPLLVILLGSGVLLTAVVIIRRPSGGAAPAATAVTTTSTPPAATTTAAVTTTTPTTATTTGTTAAPASTLADPLGALTLGPTGVGDLVFGNDADAVISQLSLVLGDADEDTGWSGAFETCPGTEARVVRWTSLQTFFTNGATEWAPEGARHFFHFGQSVVAGGGVLIDLVTARGIGVGSSLADLQAAYPGQVVISDDPLFGPLWEIDDGGAGILWGTAGSTVDDALIDSINGGPGCGE